ncbi:LysE family translocator [Marinactinospora rubrisoli]|uniref:LysE family translocator n=1 Tax=Marinactinospora rubrisoli TaxID=2715399 RepID=A0ABW2KNP2_9ACTN
MLTQLTAAIGVLALLTLVPGPDMAVVTRSALAAGRAAALRTAGGVVLGLLTWGLLAVVGLAALLAASAEAFLVAKILGAGYLICLGAYTLWQSRRGAPVPATSSDDPARNVGDPWLSGLTTNVLNPKIAVFYAAVLPTLAPPTMPVHWSLTLLVLIHAALTLAWLSGYALLLTRARAVFERPAVRRALDRVTGVVLIGFGLRVAAENP